MQAKAVDPASVHDVAAFRQELVAKIPPGKRVIDRSFEEAVVAIQ